MFRILNKWFPLRPGSTYPSVPYSFPCYTFSLSIIVRFLYPHSRPVKVPVVCVSTLRRNRPLQSVNYLRVFFLDLGDDGKCRLKGRNEWWRREDCEWTSNVLFVFRYREQPTRVSSHLTFPVYCFDFFNSFTYFIIFPVFLH